MLIAAVPVITIGMVAPAHATYYSLVSCQYKYLPELSKNVWVGTYRSQYGNLFTATFDSYCPSVD